MQATYSASAECSGLVREATKRARKQADVSDLEHLTQAIRSEVDELQERLRTLPERMGTRIKQYLEDRGKPCGNARGNASPFLQGGVRSFRVDQSVVAKSAFTLLSDDLKDLGTVQEEQKLLQTLCSKDRKCAVAVFQAKSRQQRLAATSAALRRMGIQDIAAVIDSLSSGSSRPVDQTAGRLDTAREEVPGERRAAHSPLGSEADALQHLARRLNAVETWAHAMDCSLCEEGSAAAVGNSQSLLYNMVQR
eukprot:935698-Amphidinium_carterae.1